MSETHGKEVVELEALYVDLVSVQLGSGALPMPIIILEDESELFENEAYHIALKERKADPTSTSNLTFQVSGLEQTSETMFTTTLTPVNAGDENNQSYVMDIPRQHLQTGLIISMFFGTGVFPAILVASETDALAIYNNVELTPEEPSNMVKITDNVIQICFPSAADFPAEHQRYSQLLHQVSSDSKNFRTPVSINSAINNAGRADLMEILFGLTKGDEHALSLLYKLIQDFNDVNNILQDENASPATELTEGQKKTLVQGDFMQLLFLETHPSKLAAEVSEDEDFAEEVQEFTSLFSSEDADLIKSFQSILSESPTTYSPVNSHSSNEEKVEYLTKASNKHDLKGGLALLADKINTDLIYSMDWNSFDGNLKNLEAPLTRGELVYVYGIIIAQRLLMLTETSANVDEDGPSENNVIVTTLINALTLNHETLAWVIQESILRVGQENRTIYTEFMDITNYRTQENPQYIIQGPVGTVAHLFGHKVLEENWGQDSIILALDGLEEVQNLVRNIYSQIANKDDDDDDNENACPVISALAVTLASGSDRFALTTQLGKALNIIAELNAMKHTDFTHKSDEWNKYVSNYLTEISSD